MRFIVSVLLIFILSAHAFGMEICISGRVPYEYKTETGYDGITLRILTIAFERMGIEDYKVVEKPWRRGLSDVKSGKCDVLLSGVWTEERAKFLRYSEPIGCVGWSLFAARPDVEIVKKWGGVQGFAYPEGILSQVAHVKRDMDALTQEILLKKLISGRIDSIAMDLQSAHVLARRLNMTLYPVGRRVYVPLYAMLAPQTPPAFTQALNEILLELACEGDIDKITDELGQKCPEGMSHEGTFADGDYEIIRP